MKMNRQTIIAIVLGVVAVVVVIAQLMPALFKSSPAPPPAAAAVPQTRIPTRIPALGNDADDAAEDEGDAYTQLIARVDVREMSFDREVVRNPFRPLVGPGSVMLEEEILERARAQAGDLIEGGGFGPLPGIMLGYKVNGIVWNEDEPIALVNDQVLSLGEEVEEGGLIAAITPDTVILAYEGQHVTLYLEEEQ